MNSNQFFNPNESQVGTIQIDLDSEFSLNYFDLGFIWIENFANQTNQIHSKICIQTDPKKVFNLV